VWSKTKRSLTWNFNSLEGLQKEDTLFQKKDSGLKIFLKSSIDDLYDDLIEIESFCYMLYLEDEYTLVLFVHSVQYYKVTVFVFENNTVWCYNRLTTLDIR